MEKCVCCGYDFEYYRGCLDPEIKASGINSAVCRKCNRISQELYKEQFSDFHDKEHDALDMETEEFDENRDWESHGDGHTRKKRCPPAL